MNKSNEIEISTIVRYLQKNFIFFLAILSIFSILGIGYAHIFAKKYFLISEINISPSEFLSKVETAQNRSKDLSSPNLLMINNSWQDFFRNDQIFVEKKSQYYFLNTSKDEIRKIPTTYLIYFFSKDRENINKDFNGIINTFLDELQTSLLLSYNRVIEKVNLEMEYIINENKHLEEVKQMYNTRMDSLNSSNDDQNTELKVLQSVYEDTTRQSLALKNDLFSLETTYNFLTSLLQEIKSEKINIAEISNLGDINEEVHYFKYLTFFLAIGFVFAFVISLIRYL